MTITVAPAERLGSGAGPRLWQGLASVMTWLPLILVLGFAVLWPLFAFELQSFVDGFKSYEDAFGSPGFVRSALVTFALAIADVIFAVILGTALAWCALRTPARWRSFGSMIPLMPLLVPGVAAASGWVFLLSPRAGYINTILRSLFGITDITQAPFNIYSFWGMVFVSGLIFTSFIFMFVHNGLRNTGGEYEEAAAVSGASPLRSFFTITLPQLRPALAYGSGIVFMLALGQFSAPVLLGVPARIDVLTTRMFSMLESYPVAYGEVAAIGMPLLLAGVVVAGIQRWVIGDLRRYVTVGGRAQYSPRKPSRWALTWISLFGFIAVALPLVAILYTSLSPFWTQNMSFGNLTTRNFVTVLSGQNLLSAVRTSLVASATTILIVLPAGYWAALIVTGRIQTSWWILRLLDILLLLPFAIPATLYGFALLFAYAHPPFALYGTYTIIIVAYATIMIPYSTRVLVSALIAFGPEPWEASAICGAGPARTFVRVSLPLMRRSASVAGVMVFILLFQEFAVSLLVRSATTQVVGGVLYDQYVAGSYPAVAVVALLLVAMTAVGVIIITAVGGSEAIKGSGGR